MSAAELNPVSEGKIEVGGAVEIHRAIKHVHRPGDVVELRVPNAGRFRTISGYFDDFDALGGAVAELDSQGAPGVYWTLNPVNPALLARASNKLKHYAKNTTTDADISARRILPIDLDPTRPTGISSSDTEHQAALELARRIREQLHTGGWPDPIFASSGNGAHLLYRIDLPNDPAATDLVKRILQALAERFDTALVTVDTTTYNASRIMRAYGSRARKGDSTIDRPHRQSRIIEAPEEALVVPEVLLKELADTAPTAAPAKSVYTMPQRSGGSTFDVEKFLERYGVQHRSPVPYNGGRKFVLEQCVFDPSHGAPDAAVFEAAGGQLGYRCLHNSCESYGWRDFRNLFEPVERNTRAVPEWQQEDGPPWDSAAKWWVREDLPGWSRKFLEDQVRRIEKEKGWKWIATYPYSQADGTPTMAKVRFLDRANGKTFRQFVRTRKQGWGARKLTNLEPMLYRWPEVAEADEVFLVNGEKAADRGSKALGICTTCNSAGEGEWHAGLTESLRDKSVVVVLDNDDKGEQHGKVLAKVLTGVAKQLKLVSLPGLPPKGDLWDWIAKGGTAEQLRQIVDETTAVTAEDLPETPSATACDIGEPRSTWQGRLLLTSNGEVRALLANAITALRMAPEWSDVLWYDEFRCRTVAREATPWGKPDSWDQRQDLLVTDWLHHHDIRVPLEVAGQAIEVVAGDRRFHPVREYLEDLEWDGHCRLHRWLNMYLGVEQNAYSSAVGSRWAISAVARIFEPGVKVDCCLILEGAQGIRKSTALKTLAEPWFTDQMPELGSKDASLQLQGRWIIELAELDSLSRPEVSRVKAFMSCGTDQFRPPYGKRSADFPRQCVFAGSVNHSTYLRDETGGRRFWPVACKAPVIDIEALSSDREQLWAEAVVLYYEGRTWWLDTPELNRLANEEQAARYEEDPWDELISAWVEDRDSVSIAEVLKFCLEKRKDQWTQLDKNRVGRCLRAQGWERFKARSENGREWRYQRSE